MLTLENLFTPLVEHLMNIPIDKYLTRHKINPVFLHLYFFLYMYQDGNHMENYPSVLIWLKHEWNQCTAASRCCFLSVCDLGVRSPWRTVWCPPTRNMKTACMQLSGRRLIPGCSPRLAMMGVSSSTESHAPSNTVFSYEGRDSNMCMETINCAYHLSCLDQSEPLSQPQPVTTGLSCKYELFEFYTQLKNQW